jgi:ATP-binding cassette subfamily G (WHITE) protein 2 (SNQ2)
VTGLGSTSSYQPTLGSFLNPLDIARNIGQLRHPNVKHILSGFEGVVRPGQMLRASLAPPTPFIIPR